MADKQSLKDFSIFLPIITLIIYIFGYLIISGYLSNYNVVNDDILNLNLLKAGLLFVILLIPILIIVYLNYKEPTDNLIKAFKYLPTLLINIFTYILWISLFIIDFNKLKGWERPAFFIGFILDNLFYLLATSYACRDKSRFFKFIIQIIIPVIIILYLGIKYSYLGYLYGIIIATSIVFILVLGLIGDKKYNWGHFSILFIWVCFTSYIFGLKVYKNIPNYFGGGFPYKTLIISKPNENVYLKNIGFDFNDSTFIDSVDILYVSSDKYLISKNEQIFFISKDLFNGFITSKK